MAIDFTFPDEVEDARLLVRRFMHDVARPKMAELSSGRASGDEWRQAIKDLRRTARNQGLWAPHMPEEWGSMGLGVTAVAAMSAEAVKTNMGPYLINCQAPDEGNMHTLLHFGTDEQKEQWLKPLCEGTMRSRSVACLVGLRRSLAGILERVGCFTDRLHLRRHRRGMPRRSEAEPR